MTCPNLCHDCQTVSHCEKSGCVPKIDGPAPQMLTRQAETSTDYQRGYADGLSSAAFYVTDHCQQGEEHAAVIVALRRPDRAPAKGVTA